MLPFLLLFLSLSQFPTPTSAGDPHTIKFRSPGLYPDGLTWDPSSQHFIVAAFRKGTFHSVSNAAIVETLTLNSASILPEKFKIIGLAVDHRRNRLLAAVNTPRPHLAAFDLARSSLRLLFLAPLPCDNAAVDLANDVTVDRAGNAYVTNPNGNFIWKIDVAGTNPTILSKSKIFSHHPGERNSCGLNGVVYIPNKGYLLVVQTNTGKMFKVDAVDGTATTVDLPEDLTHAAGMAVREDGVVLVVSEKYIWFLKSDDNWGRGGVIDKIALDREGYATKVTVVGWRVYVIYGYTQEGIMGKVEERDWFRIEEIEREGEIAWAYAPVLIVLGFAYVIFWRFQTSRPVGKRDKKCGNCCLKLVIKEGKSTRKSHSRRTIVD